MWSRTFPSANPSDLLSVALTPTTTGFSSRTPSSIFNTPKWLSVCRYDAAMAWCASSMSISLNILGSNFSMRFLLTSEATEATVISAIPDEWEFPISISIVASGYVRRQWRHACSTSSVRWARIKVRVALRGREGCWRREMSCVKITCTKR